MNRIIVSEEWLTESGWTRVDLFMPVAVEPADPDSDWACSIFVHGIRKAPKAIYGISPMDAIANASVVLRGYVQSLKPADRRALPSTSSIP